MSEKGGLDDLRGEIDKIDRQILPLLDQRMALALRIGEVKSGLGMGIHDPERETGIIRDLLSYSHRYLTPQEIEEVYAAIFRISRWRQGGRERVGGHLCISVLESDPERARQGMMMAAREGDLVELRLDALDEIRLNDLLPFTEGLLIVTNRRRGEGGFFRGKEEKRIAYLEEAIRYGVTYIDVEWMSPEPLRSRLLGKKGETGVILSYHNLQKTPPLEELLSLWEDMIQIDADIYKIVTWAQTLDDSLTVLRFLREAGGRGQRVISHCLGEEGKISRILAPLFGSFMAFASPEGGEEAAPGQLRAGQMRRVWEVLMK